MQKRRYSYQRAIIYKCVKETTAHPTAEMVYQWLKPDYPQLSLGTVYRNLNLLAKEGLIMRMPFPVERFDAKTEMHAHFQCLACGNVHDVEGLDCEQDLLEQADQGSEHNLQRCMVTFTGICSQCC